jgi:hypothetical protein
MLMRAETKLHRMIVSPAPRLQRSARLRRWQDLTNQPPPTYFRNDAAEANEMRVNRSSGDGGQELWQVPHPKPCRQRLPACHRRDSPGRRASSVRGLSVALVPALTVTLPDGLVFRLLGLLAEPALGTRVSLVRATDD